MSSDKIKVYYSEGESQKLNVLHVEPGIEWEGLLKLISGKLRWSQTGTRLWKKKDDDSWVLVSDDGGVLPLKRLDKLKAEKVPKL